MALNLYTRYGPRANPADANYPLGSIKNESIPGADDGTPLEKDWGNDLAGFQQRLLDEGGVTPSGNADTVLNSDYYDALLAVMARKGSNPFKTVAAAIADTTLVVGDFVSVENYTATSQSGVLFFEVVAAGTGTADGGSYIDLPNTTPPAQLKQNLTSTINVKQFGAEADWNRTTQTGTNDTVAVQAAIDYMASIPNQRLGGRRVLLFPAGQYRLDSLVFPDTLSFGIDVFGEGYKGGTQLWFDNSIASTPAIDVNIEFTTFNNMKIHGSLLHEGNDADRRDILIRGRLPDARADIDIEFNDCSLSAAHVAVSCYGRGAKFNGGNISACNDILEIYSDPLNVPPAGNDRIIMRHYTFDNVRVDAATNLITSAGTGTQKQYLLDTTITGCDFFNLDKLIHAPDATFRGLTVTGCNGLENFEDGFIECQDLIGFSINGGIYQKRKDPNDVVTTAAHTITNFILCTGSVLNGSISNCVVGQLERALIKASEINHVKIDNVTLPDLWQYDGGVTSSVLVDSDSVLDPDIIITNLTGQNAGGKSGSRVVDDNMSPENITIHSNHFDSVNVRDFWQYIPELTVAGVQSAKAATTSLAKYYRDGDYIVVQYSFRVDNPTETGNIGLTLPVTAPVPVAESPAITGTYAGGGELIKGSGWPNTITSNILVSVNPVNSSAEFVHSSGGLTQNVSIAAPLTIFVAQGFFKYRFR